MFYRFYLLDDIPLYEQKVGLYRSLLRVAVTNSRRDTDGVFAESNTGSASDSEPGDDNELNIRARES